MSNLNMIRILNTESASEAAELKKRELKVMFISKRDACRGPMAECIFQFIVNKYQGKAFSKFRWKISSAGLEKYNPGDIPEQRCLQVLGENRLDTIHCCRQVS